MICPLCNEETDEFHYDAERYVLEVIKKDHPEWVESDGACEPCMDYYKSLDKAVQLVE